MEQFVHAVFTAVPLGIRLPHLGDCEPLIAATDALGHKLRIILHG